MGLRWHIPLPGPFSISGPVLPRRAPSWTHPGCGIRHRTRGAADACPNRRTIVPAVRPSPSGVNVAGAYDLVTGTRYASIGLLERALGVHQWEAWAILDVLERDGVVRRQGDTAVWEVCR